MLIRVSDPDLLRDTMSEPDPEGRRRNKPHILMPIENVPIRSTSEGEVAVEVGSMRFWIDISKPGHHYQAFNRGGGAFSPTRAVAEELEVRITILCLDNVSIFKDLGSRNDIFIKAVAAIHGFDEAPNFIPFKTDTHKYAHEHADFNWRFVFRVRFPCLACYLRLEMMDEDILGEQLIYDPQILCLDEYLALAHTRKLSKEPLPLEPVRTTVLFDSWPAGTTRYIGISCCGLCGRRTKPTPAQLKCMVEVVPVTPGADGTPGTVEEPVGQGRDAPQPLDEPPGRFSLAQAALNPGHTLKLVLGPDLTREAYCTCTVLAAAAVVLGVLTVLYYLKIIFG
jgi:hypothetical protein